MRSRDRVEGCYRVRLGLGSLRARVGSWSGVEMTESGTPVKSTHVGGLR